MHRIPPTGGLGLRLGGHGDADEMRLGLWLWLGFELASAARTRPKTEIVVPILVSVPMWDCEADNCLVVLGWREVLAVVSEKALA